jgi:hypothetical protein
MAGGVPGIGDGDGDGKYDFAVGRSADNIRYVRKGPDNGAIYFQRGISADIPVPSSFVRKKLIRTLTKIKPKALLLKKRGELLL